jgi:hypothetical protein
VHALCPALPRALSDVVDKAMARDVEARHQSVAALAEALAPFAAARLPDAQQLLGARASLPPPPAARRRLGWLSALAGLVLAQASGIYWAVTALPPEAPGAQLLSPHGNVLASFLLPPAAAAPRGAPGLRLPRAKVPVAVVCEIPGAELYVNGARVAAAVGGEPLRFELPPGMYRFEALRDGQVLASDLALLEPGRAFELRLRAPGAALAGAAAPVPQPKAAPSPALVSTARAHEPLEAAGPVLTREQLSDEISAHLGALQRCYEVALAEEGQELPLEPTSLEL